MVLCERDGHEVITCSTSSPPPTTIPDPRRQILPDANSFPTSDFEHHAGCGTGEPLPACARLRRAGQLDVPNSGASAYPCVRCCNRPAAAAAPHHGLVTAHGDSSSDWLHCCGNVFVVWWPCCRQTAFVLTDVVALHMQGLAYTETEGDEVEDLMQLLAAAKRRFPGLQGVASGAIASDYQRLRVESV